MLLIILLFVIAGVFWVLSKIFWERYYRVLINDLLPTIFQWISLVAFVIACVVSVFAIDTQATSERYYQEALYEKEILEYRLDHVDQIGNENLYKDILEFNKRLKENKYYANSIWIGSLYNKKIAAIDYIEIIKD